MTKEHMRSGKVRRDRRGLVRPLLGSVSLAVCLAGAVQLPASSARAQDYAAAGQHFDSAQEAFSAGKFELAAREYQAAFDITKEATLLASIGESWQRAGNTAKALTAYKAYLQAAPQAPDRAAIEERVKAIESAQADAQKPAQPAQAQPTQAQPTQAQPAQPTQAQPTQAQPAQPPALPGTAVAQPGQPPALPPAQTAQNGQIPQQTAQNGQIPQQPGSVTPVPAQPTPSSPAPQQPVVPDQTQAAQPEANKPLITPPEPPPSKLRAAGWVSVASAVALITGGAVVGLGAQSRADEIRRRTTLVSGDQPLVYTDSEREAYTTLQSEGRSYNTAAISLFAVGGVAAATAITLFVVDFVRKPKSEPAKQVLLLPSVSPGSVSLSVVGGL